MISHRRWQSWFFLLFQKPTQQSFFDFPNFCNFPHWRIKETWYYLIPSVLPDTIFKNPYYSNDYRCLQESVFFYIQKLPSPFSSDCFFFSLFGGWYNTNSLWWVIWFAKVTDKLNCELCNNKNKSHSSLDPSISPFPLKIRKILFPGFLRKFLQKWVPKLKI